MQIILLEKVVNLGELGDVVNVKDGYGRNFLIPYGKAKRATTVNLAEFEAKRVELEKQQTALEKVAKKRVKEFEGFGIEISQKVGVDGKLFGSVTNIDIADAINAAGHKVVKSEIRMPNGPLKLIGEHELTIDLHHEMTAIIKVTVVGEEI